jgi:hypothetical protein
VHVISSFLTFVVVSYIALLSAGLYLLPGLIAWIRKAPDLGSVAVVNVLLGWTLIGWAAALAMALRSPRPPAAAVHIVHNPPAPSPSAVPPDDRHPAGGPGLRPHRDGCPPPLDLPARPAGPGTAS